MNDPNGWNRPPPPGYPPGYPYTPHPPQYQQQAPMVVVNQNAHPPHGYPYPPQQQIFIQPAPFNHTLHIVLSLFTCGAWIPFYLLIWIFR